MSMPFDRSWEAAFLAQLRAGRTVEGTLKDLSLAKTTVYRRLRKFPDLAAAFHAASRRSRGKSPTWEEPLLTELNAGATISQAAEDAGVSISSIYHRLNSNPTFASAFAAARTKKQRRTARDYRRFFPDEDITDACSHPQCPRLAIWQASPAVAYCDHHWTILTTEKAT